MGFTKAIPHLRPTERFPATTLAGSRTGLRSLVTGGTLLSCGPLSSLSCLIMGLNGTLGDMEARSPKEQMRIVEAISQIKISAIGFSCKFVHVKSNHFHSDFRSHSFRRAAF